MSGDISFHSTAPQGSFSIPDTDAMAEALVLDHNLSILASDPETGTLQCVMLNGVFHRDEIDMPRQEVDIEKNVVTIANFCPSGYRFL